MKLVIKFNYAIISTGNISALASFQTFKETKRETIFAK
jgi:hypothetical protein